MVVVVVVVASSGSSGSSSKLLYLHDRKIFKVLRKLSNY